MRKAALTIIGAVMFTGACSEAGSLGDVVGPQFSHLLNECRGKDQLITGWLVGQEPDANLNGIVCLRKEILRIGSEPKYYDDIVHIKERL